jgi:hypothetical protein
MKRLIGFFLMTVAATSVASDKHTAEYALKCSAFSYVATNVPPDVLMEITGAETRQEIAPFYQSNNFLGQLYGMVYSGNTSESGLRQGEILSARDTEIKRLAKVFQKDPLLILNDILICDAWGTAIADYIRANAEKLNGTDAELEQVMRGFPKLDMGLSFSEEQQELGLVLSYAAFTSFLEQGGMTPTDAKQKLREMLEKKD